MIHFKQLNGGAAQSGKGRVWFAVLFLTVSLVALAEAQPHHDVLEMTTEEYSPFSFLNDEGEIDGIATRAVQEVLKRSDMQANIRLLPWARALTEARFRVAHCVFATSRTPGREADFTWTGPLVLNQWTAFALAGRDIDAHNLQDLSTFRVGSFREDAVAQYVESYGVNVLVTAVDRDNVQRLRSGVIDIWVSGHETALVMAQQQDVELQALFTFNEIAMYLACNQDVPASQIALLQASFNAMRKDGTFDVIRAEVYQMLSMDPVLKEPITTESVPIP